jgi:hypothetical protein
MKDCQKVDSARANTDQSWLALMLSLATRTDQSYRDDLVESVPLLRRVIDESAPHLPGELDRTITSFLARATGALETPEGHSA